MASLVADYGSDEESEPDSDTPEEMPSVQPGESGTNYLISKEGDSSDSDEPKAEKKANPDKLPNPPMEKLPAPKLGKKKKGKNVHLSAASVFTNPFEKAEQAKQSVLEKHVKLTEDQNPSGKKLKICKKFKQGKCPFGKNCKYSHVDMDSNLSLGYMQGDAEANTDIGNNTPRKNFPQLPPPPKAQGFMSTLGSLKPTPGPRYSHHQIRQWKEQERHMLNDDEDDDDRGISSNKRKRRVGMAASLVPPKKAMSSLNKQRHEERPWTMKK